MRASVLLLCLLATPLHAKTLYMVWDLDPVDPPPLYFILYVESPSGAWVPPPMQVPWAQCTAVPDIPIHSYCAPVGCPPVGAYLFTVRAQYRAGLSAPSNTYRCEIPLSSAVCDCIEERPYTRPQPPKKPAPTQPPVPPDIVLLPIGPLPDVPTAPQVPVVDT